MLISVKTACKIIIYALIRYVKSAVRFWIKAVPKSLQSRNSRRGQAERTAEPFQIEMGAPNWLRRRIFHVLNSMH